MFDLNNIIKNIEQDENKGLDFKSILESSFIDVNKEIKRQPVAIGIGHYNYGQSTYPIPFGSYGDFSCIVGASKSKKTFLKSALISGYIGGRSTRYFPEVKGYDTSEKFILDIDTEQSKWHTQRVAKRVTSMVGDNYGFYKPFALRKYDYKTRVDFIDYLVYESEYKDSIGLISIDGVADLVDDVNNLDQSNEVVQKLMKWTSDKKCHIITVLHKNFGSMKPTGHLGSAVLKKAETVAFVEKEEYNTLVKCEYSRNRPFDDFRFSLNDQYLPTVNDISNIF